MRQKLSAVFSATGRALPALIKRYTAHDIAQQGAALAYYLLFSLFPILILISDMIVRLGLDISGILAALSTVLPGEVLSLADGYLRHAAEHRGRTTLYFSLVFSIYFPTRATRCLFRTVRRAYGFPSPESKLRSLLRALAYSVLMLLSAALILLLLAPGRNTPILLVRLVPGLQLSLLFCSAVRFGLVGVVVLGGTAGLYAAARERSSPRCPIFPGAVLSTVSWIVLSALYSFYTDTISHYDLIYGALDSAAVLLVWLYLSVITLILGAEINGVLACRCGRTLNDPHP